MSVWHLARHADAMITWPDLAVKESELKQLAGMRDRKWPILRWWWSIWNWKRVAVNSGHFSVRLATFRPNAFMVMICMKRHLSWGLVVCKRLHTPLSRKTKIIKVFVSKIAWGWFGNHPDISKGYVSGYPATCIALRTDNSGIFCHLLYFAEYPWWYFVGGIQRKGEGAWYEMTPVSIYADVR